MRSLSLVIFADFSTSVGDENDMVVYTENWIAYYWWILQFIFSQQSLLPDMG
jgi:hypothetical protein